MLPEIKSIIIAKELAKKYKDTHKEVISEFKLQVLMYLAQRESLIRTPNEPILQENFIAGRNGPYLKSIHEEYDNIIKEIYC